MLSQVTGKLKLGDETISVAQVAGKVSLLQLSLASNDLFDLLSQVLVSFFFAIEEFGAFRCIIYDFRNLHNLFQ